MLRTGGFGAALGTVRSHFLAGALLLALAMVGCSLFGGADPPGVGDDRISPAGGSGVPGQDRDPGRPDGTAGARALPADLKALAEGNAGFAPGLYRELASSEGNLFFSPYSISAALAMTYAGTGGETGAEMADALRFSLSPERLHPAFGPLAGDLKARTADSDGFRLEVVNAVWGQNGHPFLDSYLDLLEDHYGAGVRWADFAGSPQGSREDINRWVTSPWSCPGSSSMRRSGLPML